MPNSVRETLDRAAELDRRRQAQIAEQVNIINRIMAGEDTYDLVLQGLTETVARYKTERDDLQLKVNGLLKDIERMRSAARAVEGE